MLIHLPLNDSKSPITKIFILQTLTSEYLKMNIALGAFTSLFLKNL